MLQNEVSREIPAGLVSPIESEDNGSYSDDLTSLSESWSSRSESPESFRSSECFSPFDEYEEVDDQLREDSSNEIQSSERLQFAPNNPRKDIQVTVWSKKLFAV